jgi:hypothetical protein
VADQLDEEFSQLATSEPTQISWVIDSNSDSASASDSKSNHNSFHDKPSSFLMGLRNVASTYQEFNSGFLQSFFKKSDPFPFGLNNMATSYQALLHGSTSPIRGVLLTRVQEGLVLTITSQDYIVHWPVLFLKMTVLG